MSAFNRVAAALMLFAALAMSVEAGYSSDPNYYPFYCNRGYPKHYYKKYYSGNIETDFVTVKSYVPETYYNDCVSYEKEVKITIYLCLLASQCFDAHSMSPCCSSDGIQFASECIAQCMGYTSSDYTMGTCSSSVAVTVVDGSSGSSSSDNSYTTSSTDMTSSSGSGSSDSSSYVAVVTDDSSSTPSPCASTTGSGSSGSYGSGSTSTGSSGSYGSGSTSTGSSGSGSGSSYGK